jgi:hypothetical protein
MDFRFWKKKDTNKWLEVDQRERRSTVIIAIIFIVAIIAGIWALIYALTR